MPVRMDWPQVHTYCFSDSVWIGGEGRKGGGLRGVCIFNFFFFFQKVIHVCVTWQSTSLHLSHLHARNQVLVSFRIALTLLNTFILMPLFTNILRIQWRTKKLYIILPGVTGFCLFLFCLFLSIIPIRDLTVDRVTKF